MSEQFCIKKTPEEAKKEMEETTRKELEKLTQQIKSNPALLKPNMAYDSDTDSDYESSSSDSSSSSSSSSSRSKTKYKTKINKNAIDIFKKETTIDKLEEKNYYKTLDCHAKGVVSNSATTRSSDKQIFDNKYTALYIIIKNHF